MAVVVWLVWRSGGDVTIAVGLFALQLALNVAWSVVFFGQRKPRGGLVVIVDLWLATAATLVVFMSIDPLAGARFIPYLASVTFASVLNGTIARLNPST